MFLPLETSVTYQLARRVRADVPMELDLCDSKRHEPYHNKNPLTRVISVAYDVYLDSLKRVYTTSPRAYNNLLSRTF